MPQHCTRLVALVLHQLEFALEVANVVRRRGMQNEVKTPYVWLIPISVLCRSITHSSSLSSDSVRGAHSIPVMPPSVLAPGQATGAIV